MIEAAAFLPSATATTVKSLPSAIQSPPAHTPGIAGAALAIDCDAAFLEHESGVGQLGRLQNLADRGQHLIGRERDALAGADQPAAFAARMFECHAAHRAVLAFDRDGHQVLADQHAADLRHVLFIGRCRHVGLGAAIGDGHALRSQQLGLGRRVDRGHAAADHEHVAPNRHRRLVRSLPQGSDEIDGVHHAFGHGAEAKRVGIAEADAEKYCIVAGPQAFNREIAAERLAEFHLDAADIQNVGDLLLRDVVIGLVGGDAILVEAAALGARLEHRHLMAGARQSVSAGKPCRSGAHHGDTPAARGRRAIELASARECGVGRIALQPSNLHGARFRSLPDTGSLAEVFGRADARAHGAHDVGVEDGLGGGDRASRWRSAG